MVSHSYQKVLALDSVTLIHEGPGCVILLGANGAGKSTLLRGLVGIQKLSQGYLLLNDQEIYPESPLRKDIGYLSEQSHLPHSLTIYETLEGIAILYGLKGKEKQDALDWCIQCCKLEELLDRHCDTLSRGQRQRVGLATAILHRPPLLVLDEVHSGLDPIQTKEMNDVLKGLAQECLLIISTHRLEAADQIADHFWVLHEGCLIKNTSRETWQKEYSSNNSWSLNQAYHQLLH